MGTRSYIFTETQNNNFVGSYCHWDGYPEGVGSILLENYIDQDKVDELCNLAGFSSLQETTEETATARYDDIPSAVANSVKDACNYGADFGADYIYIHKDNEWWFYETGSKTRRHLETYLSMKKNLNDLL